LVARALEDADSPLVQLRVQVHLELAKCEEQADFVGKAKEEAEKAEAVDYGVLLDEQALLADAAAAGGSKGADAGKKAPPPDKKGAPAAAAAVAVPAEGAAEGETEELDRARPLDHVIRPMMEVLGLRVSVYDQVPFTPLPCHRSFPRPVAPASRMYRPSRSPWAAAAGGRGGAGAAAAAAGEGKHLGVVPGRRTPQGTFCTPI